MVATVVPHIWYDDPLTDGGALVGGADLSSADNAEYSAANRIAHPLTPATYSYEKWIRAHITANPDNWIGQFKVWGDGSVPANSRLRVGTASAGVAPVITPSVIAVNEFYLMTSAAKGVWDLTPRTVADLATSPYTNFLVFQLYVNSSFTPGDWGPEVIYYEYQEA